MTRLQKITFNLLLLVLQLNTLTCKPCIQTLCNTYSPCGYRDCRTCGNQNDPYCSCINFNPYEGPCGNFNCNPNCFQCSYDPTCNGNDYGNPGCFCEPCNNQYMDPAFCGYDTFSQPGCAGCNQHHWQPEPMYQQQPSNQPTIIVINDDKKNEGDRCLTDEILTLLLTSMFSHNKNRPPPPPPAPSNCGCCNGHNKNCNCGNGNGCNSNNDNNCNSGNKCSTTVQITIVLPKSDNATQPSVTIS